MSVNRQNKPVTEKTAQYVQNLSFDEELDVSVILPLEYDGTNLVRAGAVAYATRIATDSGDANVSYIGKAAVGTATSASSWQIKQVDETTGTVITYADGDSNFDNVWDNREALSYS